jgi:DinB family protein
MSHRDLLESFASGSNRLEEALRALPKEMWDYKPAPDRWSVREIIVHMPDSEASGFVRCRKIIAQSGVSVNVYDQDAWANLLGYQKRSVENALDLFRCLRKSTVELLETVEDALWENHVHHPEDGLMTLSKWLFLYDRHVTKHISQMRRNLEAWKQAGRPVAG